MFDDPKDALMKMNSQLLAAEEHEENLPEGLETPDEDIPILPKKHTPTRAEGFGRTVYADETFDKASAVVPGEGTKVKKKRRKKKKKQKQRKLPLFLLLIGILALIGWWLR